MTIDKGLTFNSHIKNRIDKGIKILNAAKNMINKSWGLNPQKSKWIYTAIVRPTITYGCHIWGGKKITQTNIKKLAKLQRLACILATSAHRSTPSKSLDRILNLNALHLHIKQVSMETQWRIQDLNLPIHKPNVKRYDSHILRNLDPIRKKGLLNHSPDTIRRIPVTGNNLSSISNPDYIGYTDGSKNETRAGAGWAITHGNIIMSMGQKKLTKFNTVYQAEGYAMLECLKQTANMLKGSKGIKVIIKTDSKSLQQSLNATFCRNKIINQCLEQINQITTDGNHIGIEWIKGHADHTGNEYADFLAKDSIQMSGQVSNIYMPKGTVKHEIRNLISTENEILWKTEPKLRQSKLMLNDIKQKTKKLIIKSNRKTIRKIIAIATGHNTLGYHMKNKGYEDDDLCRHCLEEEETSHHIAFECPAFETRRRQILIGMDKTDTLTKALKLMKEFEMFEEVMKSNQEKN